MKKIGLLLLVMLMITGCSSSSSDSSLTYMVNTSENKYGIVNDEGKVLKKGYDQYKIVDDKGYLVTKDNVTSYISKEGKVLIDGNDYPNLIVRYHMLVSRDQNDMITIFNTDGKKLQVQNDEVYIVEGNDKLPLVHDIKKKRYYILKEDGSVFKETKKRVLNASCRDNRVIFVAYEDESVIYFLDENQEVVKESKIKLDSNYYLASYDEKIGASFVNPERTGYAFVNEKGKLLYVKDFGLEYTFFEEDNLLGVYHGSLYLLDISEGTSKNPVKAGEQGEPVEVNSYYKDYNNYTLKSESVYSHYFIEDGKEELVENIQLNPSEKYTGNNPFPVYKKETGYQYYNYDGKQAFKGTYDEVDLFDKNERAIVSKADKSWLINTNGEKISKKYTKLVWIDNIYYAAYETNSKYSIIDLDGNVVIEESFLGEATIFEIEDNVYGLFNRSGTTYVYNLTDDNEIILNKQGAYEYDEAQQLIKSQNNKKYYNLDGDLVYKRG